MSHGMYLNVYVAGGCVHGLRKGHLAMILGGPVEVLSSAEQAALSVLDTPSVLSI